MKIFVVLAVCFAAGYAGHLGGYANGDYSNGGYQQQQSYPSSEQHSFYSGQQEQHQYQQQPQQHQQYQPQQEQKILILKQQDGPAAQHGNTGSSLTVAGPTHVIKTIHQVRTIDHGGKILSKTGGSSGAQAKVLVVKEIKHAQIQHAPAPQNSGW